MATTNTETKKTMGKTCKAIAFSADATDETILNTCVAEWAKRNLNADGSLKPNSYAPIYVTRGELKLSVRRVGTDLTIFHPGKSIALPSAKTTYTMPELLPEPTPKPSRVPSKKRKSRAKSKK